MEKEKILDEIFKSKGGVFKIDNGHFHLKSVKSGLLEKIKILNQRYPDMPKIHFEFISNNSLNASAIKYQDSYYIGVNIGAYNLLFDMFTKMLSSQEVLPSAGNCMVESKDKMVIDAIVEYGISYSEKNSQNFQIPKDVFRAQLASIYLELALTFLVIHECAHIIRGHLGFKSSTSNSFIWNEIEYNVPLETDESILYSQTLEMDADSMATNWAFISAKPFINMKDSKNDILNYIYKDWSNFLTNWTFAVYSMFRLFGYSLFDVKNAKRYSHPPTAIRISMITNNIATILLKDFNENVINEIIHKYFSATSEAEKAFCCVTYNENSRISYTSTFTDESQTAYIFEIFENWNLVRPLLENHAFGKLPPLTGNI